MKPLIRIDAASEVHVLAERPHAHLEPIVDHAQRQKIGQHQRGHKHQSDMRLRLRLQSILPVEVPQPQGTWHDGEEQADNELRGSIERAEIPGNDGDDQAEDRHAADLNHARAPESGMRLVDDGDSVWRST